VAAVAGLAALAVVLVTNVVDDTSEQISGSSARHTAAMVAAQTIVDDARSTEQPAKIRSWADWEQFYNSRCERLSITYGDAGVTVNSTFYIHSGSVRRGVSLDGTKMWGNGANAAPGKHAVKFDATRIAQFTIDPDSDSTMPGVQPWTRDETGLSFNTARAVCAVS
jgi:hypothetical protein